MQARDGESEGESSLAQLVQVFPSLWHCSSSIFLHESAIINILFHVCLCLNVCSLSHPLPSWPPSIEAQDRNASNTKLSNTGVG